MPIVSQCTVIHIQDLKEGLKKYTLRPERPTLYEAGQYLQLTLEKVSASDYWPISRPFSIASYSKDKKSDLEIIVKSKGGYSSLINTELRVGSELTIKYPYGDFILPELDEHTKIVALCSGVGITPLLAIIDYLASIDALSYLHLHYSVKTMSDLLEAKRINFIDKDHLHLYVTREVSEGSINRRIQSVDLEERYDNKESYFYISGSNEFIADMKTMVESLGYDKIIVDSWS